MYRFFVAILISIPSFCYSQVNDVFSDGDFTNSPSWDGTTGKFTVNSDKMLQLAAPAEASEAWLFTRSTAVENAEWSFRIVLDLNPSSNNYTRVYLAADANVPADIRNTMYVEVGQTADDISLYSMVAGEKTKLIDGTDDRVDLSTVDVLVNVKHEGGSWTLKSNTGTGWFTEGSCTFTPGFGTAFFGIYCKYTSTRSTKFYFDDILVSGEPYHDDIPPALRSFDLINGERMLLSFSEVIDTLQLSPDNFSLKKSGRDPSSAVVVKTLSNIELCFNPGLEDVVDDTLLIKEISDVSGNVLADTAIVYSYIRVAVESVKVETPTDISMVFTKPMDEEKLQSGVVEITPGSFGYSLSIKNPSGVEISLDEPLEEGTEYYMLLRKFTDVSGDTISSVRLPLLFYRPRRFDVVFSEIMPDPDPPVALPESEYIEIYNRSGFPLDMHGWQLLVNDKSSVLPEDTIRPGEYLLLVPGSKEEEWKDVSNMVPLSPWPTIVNSESNFVLVSPEGDVIDALKYSFDAWNDGSFKQDGGWSFEKVDSDNMSGAAENWLFSVDPSGGTPGVENSVRGSLPDKIAPEIRMITFEGKAMISVRFSEPMDLSEDDLVDKFKIRDDAIGIKNIFPDTVFLDECRVVFAEDMKRNYKYEFSEIYVSDIEGNPLFLNEDRYFGRPDTVSPGGRDVVINEVLFNPRPGGYDFVELFNRSQKILGLKDMCLANIDDGEVTKLFKLSGLNRLIFPDDYLVFTWSAKNIANEYRCPVPEHLIEMAALPSMPNDSGAVILTNLTGEILDQFHYSVSMHFPLLNDVEGVSLERVSPDAATDSPDNWKSASAQCGYATPTAKNSQYKDVGHQNDNGFSLDEELFSPDGDGYSDFLILNYSFYETENVATVRVFNAKGIPVKTLANNKLLGTAGFLTWDGTNDDGKLVRPGIYVILAETYDLSGGKTKQKLICVVGTRSTP